VTSTSRYQAADIRESQGSLGVINLAQPLHTLKHEHRVIERALHALNGVCVRLEWGDPVPHEALSELVDFIGAFADAFHHGKEEAYLFPALDNRGIPRDAGPLEALERQHEIERYLTGKMRSAVEKYREVDPASRSQFVEAASRYVDHLTAHMEAEEAILFRLADEVLEEPDRAALAAAFKQAESQLSPRTKEDFEKLADELEEKWAL
jgi:hemerythrin-like domain-containing protein